MWPDFLRLLPKYEVNDPLDLLMGNTHLPISGYHRGMPSIDAAQIAKPRQVSADDRSRLALGKSGVGAYENFFVTVFQTGHIVLTPVVAIPKSELPLWNDAQFMDSLTRGISQAVSGQTKSLDHLLDNSKARKTKSKTTVSKQRKQSKVKV